jgi:hypothetical protein
MLSAVEIYNKPAFNYREEAFAILAVNSWELLLKARILQIDGNRLSALFEYERRELADGTASTMLYRKKNRAGNTLTIGLFKAYDRLVNDYADTLDPAIRKNLDILVEIRDNSVHFLNKDLDLVRSIHEISAASLKNYVSAARQWFAIDFSQYRIFLMPLAFVSGPSVLEGVQLNTEERHVLKYLKMVRDEAADDPASDFNVAVTIELRIKRSKDPVGVAVTLSDAPEAIPIALEEEDIRERYPWSYDILTNRLQKRFVDFKVNAQYHKHRKTLEKDPKLCRERLLDPANKDGMKKNFYSPNILRAFDPHYTRGTIPSAASDVSAVTAAQPGVAADGAAPRS